jgi:hypothetical protein
MNIFRKHFTIIIALSIYTATYCSDDSTLYVKTTYQHEIVNGRNTARKYAIRQEMLNSDGELFREVFYDPNTKQVDHVFYYYYNADGTIHTIERTNSQETVTEYFKYRYKKKRLLSVEHFVYNATNKESDLLGTTKYSHKKNTEKILEYNRKKELVRSEERIYNDTIIEKSISMDYRLDSAYTKITSRRIENGSISGENEFIISKSSDTIKFRNEYHYNNKNLVESIITYDADNDEVSKTQFQYTSKGSLVNKRIIGKNNYYIENLTFELRKYYRKLPVKLPEIL